VYIHNIKKWCLSSDGVRANGAVWVLLSGIGSLARITNTKLKTTKYKYNTTNSNKEYNWENI